MNDTLGHTFGGPRSGPKYRIQASPWRVVLSVRGVPRVVVMPRMYGRFRLFISNTRGSSDIGLALKLKRTPRINVLDVIQGLPEAVRATLTDDEKEQLLPRVAVAVEHFAHMERARGIEQIAAAHADVSAAANYLTASPPAPGQAKWSSRQAVEKCLRGYIFRKSQQRHDRSVHPRGELYDQARALGLPMLNQASFDSVQCEPSIRHDGCPMDEAMTAHFNAIVLCGEIAKAASV